MATVTDVAKATANEVPEIRQAMDEAGIRLENASLREIAPPIISNPLLLNKFLSRIYNKFILSEVINGRFENPLAELKRGNKQPYGDTIERMIFNPAKAISYYSKDDNILTSAPPDVHVEYIRVTRQDKYPISIPRPVVQQAFMSEGNFGEFMQGAMNTLYNGDSIDEFNLMKKIVSDSYNLGYLNHTEIGSTAKAITKQIINKTKLFKYPSSKENSYSRLYPDSPVTTWCRPEEVYLIAKAETVTDIDVDELSAAFNLDKIKITNNIVEVDAFPDDNIEFLVCDRSFFQVADTLYELAEFARADDLSTKSYLHHWQTMTFSLFCNAHVFNKAGTSPENANPALEG